MFQHKRLNMMFNHIRKNEYTPVSSLQSLLNITDRTIRNDILEINDTLSAYGALVKLKRNYGYYIEITDDEKYSDFLKTFEHSDDKKMNIDTSEERIKYILNELLSSEDYVSMDELSETVFISKNTLNKYIKTIKNIVNKYDLEYITKPSSGVKIIGSEDRIRKLYVEYILSANFNEYVTSFTKEERSIFSNIDLDWLRKITIDQLNSHFVKTSDYNMKNIIIHLALMTTRVLGNHYINLYNITPDSSIMGLINGLCREIEGKYDIILSQSEKNYMYLHLIANTHLDITYIDDEKLRDSINQMLEVIYTDFNFDLRNDEILCADLFRHLKSIFTSKLYDLNSNNPLLETIKTNYPLEYEITLTAIAKTFVFEPYVLKEDDVGYVSVYIGAAIERCYYKSQKKKNVILVCGSGHATTRMLETRLNIVFPDKINIVKCLSYNEYSSYTKEDVEDIDFVITTITLDNNLLPSVMVDFALNNKDVESINRHLSKMLHKRLQMFEHFFDKDLFMRLKGNTTKEDVIRTMYQKTYDKGIVDERFIDSVLKREEIGKTNMNDVFALPHPMELCATDTKVVVALLDNPIKWNESNMIQIVFMLVIKQGEQTDFEHLYDIFIEIISDSKLQQKIINSQTYEEFMDVLYDGISID
ncbi:BglG family transcription antiterminator [Eubacterium sp.]|uniref:BglG family transcription antiterminator n=1 Tax=Eubacterium sp. TaxID=142586 RepID=UPI00399A7458